MMLRSLLPVALAAASFTAACGPTLIEEEDGIRTSAIAPSTPYAGDPQNHAAFAIEFVGASGAFVPYTTYTVQSVTKTFYPQIHARSYRYRVRAQEAGSYGPWSNYASFKFK